MPPTGHEAFDAWVAPQRTAAISRILKAVHKKAVHKTAVDEVRLADDIFQADAENPYQGSEASVRLKKVKRILKNVEKQAALIDADAYLKAILSDKKVGLGPLPPIWALLFELRSLENTLAYTAKESRSKADLPHELKGRRPSELEWLAGVSLPLVYERHFQFRAGRSRNAMGEPSGPTVRFIEATLTELGMPYSPESIVRAFSRLAPLRNDYRKRRKSVIKN